MVLSNCCSLRVMPPTHPSPSTNKTSPPYQEFQNFQGSFVRYLAQIKASVNSNNNNTHLLLHLHTYYYIYALIITFTHLLLHLRTCYYIYALIITFTHLLLYLRTCYYIYALIITFTHLLLHLDRVARNICSLFNVPVELEFRNVGICGGRKTGEPVEKPSELGENQQQIQPA